MNSIKLNQSEKCFRDWTKAHITCLEDAEANRQTGSDAPPAAKIRRATNVADQAGLIVTSAMEAEELSDK